VPLAPLLGLVVAAGLAPAEASTFRHLSLEELALTSDAVVQVEVLDLRSDWSPDRKDIRTWAEVKVVRALEGDLAPGDTLTVVEVGGTVGDLTMQAAGFPQFVEGAQLLVFLTHWEDASRDWRVSGYGQGFYEVVREAGVDRLYPAAVQGNGPRTTGVTLDVVVPRGTRVEDLAASLSSIRR
jgi:hypothetical protein